MKTTLIVYLAVAGFWAAFVVTQIVMPAIRGTALFPFLRKDRREAESGLVDAREKEDERAIRNETQSIKTKW